MLRSGSESVNHILPVVTVLSAEVENGICSIAVLCSQAFIPGVEAQDEEDGSEGRIAPEKHHCYWKGGKQHMKVQLNLINDYKNDEDRVPHQENILQLAKFQRTSVFFLVTFLIKQIARSK